MHRFSVCYVSRTLWNILIILGSNDEQDQTTSHTIMTTSAVLLLELSPFLMFEFDLSLLCNTNTLWNILMMLGKNVEQDEMCCIQE